ncbi:hypothetical protein RGC22_01830 [Helicobacter pylori]|nr:hypothetical protein [Helicobacter pylori]
MAFKHSIIQAFNHSSIQSFNHSIIQAFNHSSIQSFKHSSNHPIIQSSNQAIKQRYPIVITFTKTVLKIPYSLLFLFSLTLFPLSLTHATFLKNLIP